MSFVYRGTSSDTMHFNVTERQVYNAPAFDVNAIEVPGRSGDVLNSQNRFKNKTIVYTGFLREQDFTGDSKRARLSRGLRNLKAWICGDPGKYHDLTDDYDPGYIRRAFVSGETAINEILDQPDGVTITVTFYAEPFMYEESDPIELPETGTASGAIASFEGVAAPLQSLVFSIEPNQSGSGDPSPSNIRPISGWSQVDGYDDPIYGGTIHWNQVGRNDNAPTSRNGLTITREADGYTVSGTANASPNVSASGWFGFATASTSGYVGHKLFASHKLVSGTISNPTELYIALNATSATADRLYPGDEKIITYSSAQNSYFICSNGNKFTNAKLRLQVFDLTAMFGAGNEPATVAAFKALFPKDYYAYNTGTDTCVSAVNGDPYTPITISLGQTVYGGALNVVSGKLTAKPYYASYSGQALVGPWISSHDKYVAGATPTTGAQVVDMGAAGTEYDVTPQTISTLQGTNNIWADAGETTVVYVVPTENPTEWPSKPLLEITMSGAGTLTVNGKTWSIASYTGTLICDSEIMDWYDAGALKNSLVSGDGFPELVPGDNVITYTGGITKVVATPRWRTL